jgi:hypothetical protein
VAVLYIPLLTLTLPCVLSTSSLPTLATDSTEAFHRHRLVTLPKPSRDAGNDVKWRGSLGDL